MKKIFLKPFLCALFVMATTFNLAAQNITIDETNFPDKYFREFLTQKVTGGDDGVFTPTEISNITSMNIDRSLNNVRYYMVSIQGIEHFTALTSLTLSQLEALSSVDVSGLTNLQYFEIFSCREVASLNVSGLTHLRKIKVWYSNLLTSLDLSNLTSLEMVDCYNLNGLEAINFDGSTGITNLQVKTHNLSYVER